MRWLKHAFAVEPPGPAEPTPSQQPSVDWLCSMAARRRLTTPAWMALHICRPLNWVGSMSMHFMTPAVWAVAPEKLFCNYRAFAGYLENRGSIDYMIRRVEHFEARYRLLEKQANDDADDSPTDGRTETRGGT